MQTYINIWLFMFFFVSSKLKIKTNIHMKNILLSTLIFFGLQANAQLWNVQLNSNPTNLAAGLAGVAWSGTEFWVAEWNGPTIYTADVNGNSTGNFTIAGVSGTRSITTDGTYMYIGTASTFIYQVDPTTRTLVSTISTSVPSCRYLTYDPTLDSGAGGFWTGAYNSDITAVSMTGLTLNIISASTHGLQSIYGMAYDGYSTGGPYLWAFDQGGNGSDIHQLTINGSPTGVSRDATVDIGAGGTAGGLFICNNYMAGTNSMIGISQGVSLFSYELSDPPSDDPALITLDIENYVVNPSVVDIKGTIQNTGLNTITDIDVKWSDGTNTYTDNLTGLNIPMNGTYNFTHSTSFNVSNFALNTINVWIEHPADLNTNNNSLTTSVSGVSFIPTKRVVFEEATGTWCGWCPRGTVALENLALSYPDNAIGIAVHNGDPMTVNIYDNGLGGLISGYPSGVIDRKSGDVDPGDFMSLFSSYVSEISPVEISAVATWNATNRMIDIQLTGEFVASLSGDYRFNAVILEDGVGPYSQTNYYSFQSQNIPLVSPSGFDWQAAGSNVSVPFDHVARAILGGFEGTASSIPSTITAGGIHTHNYTHTLPASQNENNIHVVGMVIDNNTGEILNGISVSLSGMSTDIDNNIESKISIYPNPAKDMLKIEGEYDQVEIYDIFGKLIIKTNEKGLINVSELCNGIYMLNIKEENNIITRKITINK